MEEEVERMASCQPNPYLELEGEEPQEVGVVAIVGWDIPNHC